jgi:hypothetical protein
MILSLGNNLSAKDGYVAALDEVFLFPTAALVIEGVTEVAADDSRLEIMVLEVLLNGLVVEPNELVVLLEILLVDTIDVNAVDPL